MVSMNLPGCINGPKLTLKKANRRSIKISDIISIALLTALIDEPGIHY